MPIRPPRVSLIWKLAVAYLGLALIAAFAARTLSLSVELRELDHDLNRGVLERATQEAAGQFDADMTPGSAVDPAMLQRRLTASLRSVEASLSDAGDKGVLSELGEPISVELRAQDGRVLAHAGAARGATGRGWRYSAPVPNPGGAVSGMLVVDLVRRAPGLRALLGDGFEWPALLIYAAVFGLGSAIVLQFSVTRRLRDIARTADAWSGGDFSHAVADPSADEIGQLSRRLDQMARQLEVLVAMRAEFAGVSERQRLARELHDTVKQKAFALQLQLAAAQRAPGLDPQVARAIEDARGITREIQEELSHLIGETTPASDQPFGPMLAERAETWGRRGRFAVRADFSAAEAVAPAHRPILIRVLDEALANVMRHSGARTAVVSLRQAGDRLELTVEDDGRGLGAVSEGMGLRNMGQRAADLPDGRLSVGAGAGGGARVALAWARQ